MLTHKSFIYPIFFKSTILKFIMSSALVTRTMLQFSMNIFSGGLLNLHGLSAKTSLAVSVTSINL
jgi:hypothetical protein